MNENHFPSIANIASYVQNIETPCLFLSLQEIKNNFRNLSNALPNVSFYYAVKANPNEHVINTLYSVGCKFYISTNTEIDTIKKCNVSPSDCIHTHPIKSIAEIVVCLEILILENKPYKFTPIGSVRSISKNSIGFYGGVFIEDNELSIR